MIEEDEDRIRERAHSLWENEGRPEGRALHHWLKAEGETGGGPAHAAAHPDEVDRAAGPSHGRRDFGGHDAEAEGSAAAGVGGQRYPVGQRPRQAATDEVEVGEKRVSTDQRAKAKNRNRREG